MYSDYYGRLGISQQAFDIITKLESELMPIFSSIEGTELHNQAKVLSAFHKNRVASYCFNPSTGYGYDDIGRDTLDRVFSDAIGTDAAVVSPHLISGTHAIYTVLAGLLKSGDMMLSITGKPYDTLVGAIGIDTDEQDGCLRDYGIEYRQVDLSEDGCFCLSTIENELKAHMPKVVYFQRSRGYAWREAISPAKMSEVFQLIKSISPNSIIVVDNCYGEFTQKNEPTDFGADIIVGSLIKNAGGGLAPTGGYFAGKREYVNRISARHTVPGIGREAGSYFGSYLPFYQGIFSAPHTVAQSLKTSALFAKVFEYLNLPTMPPSTAERSDIVQALRFNEKEDLISFCRCIQSISPIDGYVSPEPWEMPGYNNEIIMAAGTFIQGSSIELTADAPICEPYTAYVQGSLNYSHGKLAVMRVLSYMINGGVKSDR